MNVYNHAVQDFQGHPSLTLADVLEQWSAGQAEKVANNI